MKVYLARDWRGVHVFKEPPVLMKCGGLPDIWSGHNLSFFIIASDIADDVPRGKYIERDVWWSIIHVIK